MSTADERARFLASVAADPQTADEHYTVAEAISQDRQLAAEQVSIADHLVELGYLFRNPDGTYEAIAGDPRKWRRTR